MKSLFAANFTAFLMIVLFFGAGCGSGKLPLGKVEGTVTYDGKPLKQGAIIFTVPGTRDASGIIENGNILKVTTFTDGDGVPVGEALVAIVAVDPLPDVPPPAETPNVSPGTPGVSQPSGTGGQKFSIPVRYTNTETSGLKASITPGVNTLQFDLTQ
ncbi:MAG: hypothetical protein LBQ54_11460 [Planctomycetaceae bacterium]|jgi:hypothetical protein|nr:hypothetical protein [Planctomycetaceae bacterium]